MTIHQTITHDQTDALPLNRHDLIKESCERRAAAKLADLLPFDDASARRIIGHLIKLYDSFISIETCQQAAIDVAYAGGKMVKVEKRKHAAKASSRRESSSASHSRSANAS